MVFNELNLRHMFFGLIVIVIIGVIVTGKFIHKEIEIPPEQPSNSESFEDDHNNAANIEKPDFKFLANTGTKADDNDEETLKKMAQEMEKDREQQRIIKDLRMKKEETNLELEEQKTLTELNKLRKDAFDPISEGKAVNDFNLDIKIIYLGGSDKEREAILSVNGTNYYVKDKDRLLKNLEVLSITNNDVTVRFLNQEVKTVKYQFKPD